MKKGALNTIKKRKLEHLENFMEGREGGSRKTQFKQKKKLGQKEI